MATPIKKIVDSFSAERKERIKSGSAELIKEYRNLLRVRKELGLTQEQLAGRLSITQENVSRLERRKDMRLSTLRKYIEALGGELELYIKMPGEKGNPSSTTRLEV